MINPFLYEEDQVIDALIMAVRNHEDYPHGVRELGKIVEWLLDIKEIIGKERMKNNA